MTYLVSYRAFIHTIFFCVVKIEKLKTQEAATKAFIRAATERMDGMNKIRTSSIISYFKRVGENADKAQSWQPSKKPRVQVAGSGSGGGAAASITAAVSDGGDSASVNSIPATEIPPSASSAQ